MIRTIFAAATVGFLAGAANASPIYVDLTSGILGGDSSATFSQSGVSGTIYAGSDCSGFFCNTVITTSPTGIGVSAHPLDFQEGVDGFIGNESLTVIFDRAIELVSVKLWNNSFLGSWDVFVNGTMIAENSTSSRFFTGGVLADSFGVSADAIADDFTLKGFTVEVAPVPLPAGALLLPAACAAMFGFRRKRA